MSPLIGRHGEMLAVAELLAAAAGEPAAVILDGEPGIGKTTLWLNGLQLAREQGIRVLAARGSAAESVLAYAGLADLLADVDADVWADLPRPQHVGLAAALLSDGEIVTAAVDQRAVGAAFLAVLTRLAARSPILVAIDDLQWLDASSAAAVSFAARRLPHGVAWLATARTDTAAASTGWFQLSLPDAVRRIPLGPLTMSELHDLLVAKLGRPLTRPTMLRIHQLSAGNPFYATELAREIHGRTTGTDFTLPSSLTELTLARISRVGEPALDALLAISSLADPTIQTLATALEIPPPTLVDLLGDAETEGIIAIDGNRVHFAHPLLAHAVHVRATPAQRRAMHRRLAQIVTEPELCARHLALGATGPDPQTLEALDAAAELARRRGAPFAAAELLDLARDRGGDTPERRIRSARYHFDAGDPARARHILAETITALSPGTLHAEALSLLGFVRLYDDNFLDAAILLEQALDEAGDHLELRVTTAVTLAFSQYNAGLLDAAADSASTAVADATRLGQPHLLSQALTMRVLAGFIRGDGLDQASLDRALELEDRSANIPVTLKPRMHNAQLLSWTGRLDEAHHEMRAIRHQCHDYGQEGDLIFVSWQSVLVEVWRANFIEATSIADDSMRRALQLGGDVPLCVALTMRCVVAAYAGQQEAARRDAAEAVEATRRCGSPMLAMAPIAFLGFLEVSLGNHGAAVDVLEPVLEPLLSLLGAEPMHAELAGSFWVPDAVEALIGVGRLDDTQPLIDWLERDGLKFDRAWMMAAGGRCRAMLSAARGDLAVSVTHARAALAHHDRVEMPFERARTLLTLGRIERRLRHWRPATAALTDALATFEVVGTPLWAAHARAALDRGVPGRGRSSGLSPTERRVAELAASGMNNENIAATLFVTRKTVEVNLSRVYRKLGIHSRSELYHVISPPLAGAPTPQKPADERWQ